MHRTRRRLVTTGSTLTLALSALAFGPTPCRAALLKPDAAQSFPDLSGDIVGTQSYVYDPANQWGVFTLNNTPTLLALGPNTSSEVFVTDSGGTVRSQVLQVKLDWSGRVLPDPGNSFAVYGSVTVDGKTLSGLLLQGTPTGFGFASPNPQAPAMGVYDVSMNLTGGLLQPAYGSSAYMRIIAETNSTFDGTFTRDFNGLKAMSNVRSYNTVGTPTPIPEPTTFAVLLVCSAGGLAFKNARRLRGGDLNGPDGDD